MCCSQCLINSIFVVNLRSHMVQLNLFWIIFSVSSHGSVFTTGINVLAAENLELGTYLECAASHDDENPVMKKSTFCQLGVNKCLAVSIVRSYFVLNHAASHLQLTCPYISSLHALQTPSITLFWNRFHKVHFAVLSPCASVCNK